MPGARPGALRLATAPEPQVSHIVAGWGAWRGTFGS